MVLYDYKQVITIGQRRYGHLLRKASSDELYMINKTFFIRTCNLIPPLQRGKTPAAFRHGIIRYNLINKMIYGVL